MNEYLILLKKLLLVKNFCYIQENLQVYGMIILKLIDDLIDDIETMEQYNEQIDAKVSGILNMYDKASE